MKSYKKEEIFTATDVVRDFSAILKIVSSKEIEKAVIVKNNSFRAVLVHIDDYEKMREALKVLEKFYSNSKRVKSGN